MKKKNAFTLIELLAVIVILAIIALIAVPQIMKILYQARLKAAEDATYGMIKSTESFLASQILNDEIDKNDFTFRCYKNGVCKDSVEKDEDDETEYPEYLLDYKGKKIIGGEINVLDRNLIQVDEIIAFGFKCSKDYDEEIVHCTPLDGTEVYYNEGQNEEEVIDKNPGVICGDTPVEQYDSMTECHIRSMDDWNEFKKLVNTDNKNFQDKRVILDVNLSFSGLTFEEIGKTTNFKGTFYGRNKTLSNITINSNNDNIGIFKINEGIIEYLKIDNVNVTSTGNNVGSLAGINYNQVKAITATNVNITGNQTVGGIIGYNYYKIKNAIVSGNITGTYGNVGGITGETPGITGAGVIDAFVKDVHLKSINNSNHVAGITGEVNGSVVGVVEKATIESTGGDIYCAARYGSLACGSASTINGNSISPNYGTALLTTGNGMLPIYNTYIDTYMGGDDGDGYYFDYDKHGNIVIKSTADEPIEFNLHGDGSESNPYLISNVKEWKQATLRSNETGAYFKITKDINFNNVPTYPMATLAGTLNGDNHKLSNFVLYGTGSNIGMVLQNNGTIEKIKLDNLTITGDATNVGAVSGFNNGNILGITATNLNITGNRIVGGIVGENYKKVKNVIVTGNITGINDCVGGATGETPGVSGAVISDALIKDVYLKSINNSNHVAGITGEVNGNVGGVVEKVTITSTGGEIFCSARYGTLACGNTSTINGNAISPNYGTSMLTVGNGMLPIYNSYIDTYLDGDDGDGLYFDYDDSGEIAIKNTTDNPIIFNLQGNGTESNPYLIANTNDWKQAVLRANETGAYFKITSNINFNNIPTYPMATLAGNLNGDGHTLSNMVFYGTGTNMGIVMVNNGTIENLKLDSITVTGDANRAGALVGTNNNLITAITATNLNVSGNELVGGIAGYNYQRIKNAIVDGNITGINSYVGGITGETPGITGAAVTDVIVKDVNLKSINNGSKVAGITGEVNGTVKGIVEKATIESTGRDIYCAARLGTQLCGDASTINGNPISPNYGTSLITVQKAILPIYDKYVDTYIDGDDGDGYYFDYDNNDNIIIKNTKTNPISFNLNGAGTESSPYLISNANDWKQAVLKGSTTDTYYKITNDINFENKTFYPFQTFRGILNGDGHTLSNVKLYGTGENVGIFMYNAGYISNLKINNVTITGNANRVGALAGTNEKEVIGITASNVDISGNNLLGGVIGYNYYRASNIIVDGKVTGTGSNIGGATGETPGISGAFIKEVYVKDVTLTSTAGGRYIAGITGQVNGTVGGVVEKVTITSTGNNLYCAARYGTLYCGSASTINGTAISNSTINGDKLTFYNSYIDTDIDNTDSNSDGYYFGYDSSNNIIIKKA